MVYKMLPKMILLCHCNWIDEMSTHLLKARDGAARKLSKEVQFAEFETILHLLIIGDISKTLENNRNDGFID